MKRFRPVRIAVASVLALAVCLSMPISGAQAAGAAWEVHRAALPDPRSLCADAWKNPARRKYVGHDEPSVAVQVQVPGRVTTSPTRSRCPRTRQQPNAVRARRARTWNFQLRPTFWFGMTMCDTESAPNFTKHLQARLRPQRPRRSPTPESTNYIGKHPGNAYMELQFYPPGYVEQFEGFGCTATSVLRGDDDRQLRRRTRTPGSSTTTQLQQLHPRWRGAHQLGVHHPQRTVAGSGQPAVHRNVHEPELRRGQPERREGPVHEPG